MNKEIDIQDLIINLFSFFKKNFWILLLFGSLGLAAGFLKYYFQPPIFESEMTVISKTEMDRNLQSLRKNRKHFYSCELAVNKINFLKKILEKGNKEQLAQILNIDFETAEKIETIDSEYLYPIEGTDYSEDKEATDYFKIKVSVTDKDILPILQKAFKTFIETDPFIAKKIQTQKTHIQNILAEIAVEIKELDDAQNIILSQIKSGKLVSVYMGENSLYTEKAELLVMSADIKNTLEKFTAYTALTDFIKSEQNKNGLLKNLIIFGFVSLVLGLIFIFFRDYLKLVKKQ
ncbi:MAG: hypothetical protein U9N85_05260 [Bacteroidota bacterium]|nr:hypothetical protein [Bacteroidota bacterium]